MAISKQSFDFLKTLSKNNNRDWFNEHKGEYQQAQENIIAFADDILHNMNEFDVMETPSGKKALKRIYRDVRFSKDKSPYKTHYGLVLSRATAARRGTYYIHLQPGESFIGGGFWGPEKEDLLRIRKHIAADDSYFREVIESADFKKHFGSLQGERLKTAPKGFDKEHPSIDLLRYKQFLVGAKFSDKEVLSPNFVKQATETLQAIGPFFDIMTEMLTTNLNGESLLD